MTVNLPPAIVSKEPAGIRFAEGPKRVACFAALVKEPENVQPETQTRTYPH
jgi:hypothetical protein